jgi:lipoprotein-releasing system permease protein
MDLRDRILGTTAHANILSLKGNFGDYWKISGEVENTPGVISASPYVYSQVLISGRSGASGAILRGVDVQSAKKTTGIAKFVKAGMIEDLEANEETLTIILGKELADRGNGSHGRHIALRSHTGSGEIQSGSLF